MTIFKAIFGLIFLCLRYNPRHLFHYF